VGAGVVKAVGESLGVAVGAGEAACAAVAEACVTGPADGVEVGTPVSRSEPKPSASTATSAIALKASPTPITRSAERRCIGQS
jgi:hypothetical protein